MNIKKIKKNKKAAAAARPKAMKSEMRRDKTKHKAPDRKQQPARLHPPAAAPARLSPGLPRISCSLSPWVEEECYAHAAFCKFDAAFTTGAGQARQKKQALYIAIFARRRADHAPTGQRQAGIPRAFLPSRFEAASKSKRTVSDVFRTRLI